MTVSIIPDNLFNLIFDSRKECSELHCSDTETLLCFYKGFIQRVCVFNFILKGEIYLHVHTHYLVLSLGIFLLNYFSQAFD